MGNKMAREVGGQGKTGFDPGRRVTPENERANPKQIPGVKSGVI
jgi:hypothetical protein